MSNTIHSPMLSEKRGAIGLTIASWLLIGFLYNIPYIVKSGTIEPHETGGHILASMLGLGISIGFFPLIDYCLRLTARNGFAVVFFAVALASVLMSTIDIEIFDWIADFFTYERSDYTYSTRWTANLAVYTSQFSLITAIIWIFKTLATRRVQELELAEAQALVAETASAVHVARLSALRYQLNPHFLFNTLNSVSSLVITRRNKEAEEMLDRLSGFLRVTLQADPQAHHTLDNELDTVMAYLDIERIRFGDRIAIDVECPPLLREASLPAFLLQPLVENAVKYAVSDSHETVTIRIEAAQDGNDLVVIVEDDGHASVTNEVTHGSGVGLSNIRTRIETLYGDQGSLEIVKRELGFLARVRLPLEIVEEAE